MNQRERVAKAINRKLRETVSDFNFYGPYPSEPDIFEVLAGAAIAAMAEPELSPREEIIEVAAEAIRREGYVSSSLLAEEYDQTAMAIAAVDAVKDLAGQRLRMSKDKRQPLTVADILTVIFGEKL